MGRNGLLVDHERDRDQEDSLPSIVLPLANYRHVVYRAALFVDGLYGSACKEIVPFNGSNSGSLCIRTAEVSWAVAATKASASETD
jgi:hypothetical protein